MPPGKPTSKLQGSFGKALFLIRSKEGFGIGFRIKFTTAKPFLSNGLLLLIDTSLHKRLAPRICFDTER
jgi:hypothetical protein